MKTGAEIPFRRSKFARETGSLIFDRERDAKKREGNDNPEDMRVWQKGRFRKG